MITKAQVNHIQLLSDKKYRTEHLQFVVEGDKMVKEAISANAAIIQIIATEAWLLNHAFLAKKSIDIITIKSSELPRISQLKTPQEVIAIIAFQVKPIETPHGVCLVLDGIQDPGNMGSVLRIADWFGIATVFCSNECADMYNSKVLQASMGSIFRVSVYYTDLQKLLETNESYTSYAATLYGESLHNFDKITSGFIILGNESKGIHNELLSVCTHKITIPRLGKAESLNVAVAGGIICHHLLS